MIDGTWAFVLAAAFAAGFVDAMAGGGGLIQLPALLTVWRAAPMGPLLGTNRARRPDALAGVA